jgi:hypothetical protein
MSSLERPLKIRLIVAGVLAACAVALSAGENIAGRMAPREETPAAQQAAEARIAATVDTLFARYGIPKDEVKSWRPKLGGAVLPRVESRVNVSPSFLSVNFNHDLNLRLAGTGAHVVGTERSKDHIVTMHIIRGGMTIRSIGFVTDPDR